MTFGNADFAGVPWDVIVKRFRSELGAKSFKDVSGYGDELLSYLRTHAKLFPATHREKTFRRKVEKASSTIQPAADLALNS